jgi:hypothetical protein
MFTVGVETRHVTNHMTLLTCSDPTIVCDELERSRPFRSII